MLNRLSRCIIDGGAFPRRDEMTMIRGGRRRRRGETCRSQLARRFADPTTGAISLVSTGVQECVRPANTLRAWSRLPWRWRHIGFPCSNTFCISSCFQNLNLSCADQPFGKSIFHMYRVQFVSLGVGHLLDEKILSAGDGEPRFSKSGHQLRAC